MSAQIGGALDKFMRGNVDTGSIVEPGGLGSPRRISFPLGHQTFGPKHARVSRFLAAGFVNQHPKGVPKHHTHTSSSAHSFRRLKWWPPFRTGPEAGVNRRTWTEQGRGTSEKGTFVETRRAEFVNWRPFHFLIPCCACNSFLWSEGFCSFCLSGFLHIGIGDFL